MFLGSVERGQCLKLLEPKFNMYSVYARRRFDQFLGDSKSEASARSTDSTTTAAAENEEQLLGVGQLPKGKKWLV